MYHYKIANLEGLDIEIDNLVGFCGKKELLKRAISEKIISDARENIDQLSPEKLFKPIRLAVWFHSIYYPRLYSSEYRYDRFFLYHCQVADNRQDISIILE